MWPGHCGRAGARPLHHMTNRTRQGSGFCSHGRRPAYRKPGSPLASPCTCARHGPRCRPYSTRHTISLMTAVNLFWRWSKPVPSWTLPMRRASRHCTRPSRKMNPKCTRCWCMQAPTSISLPGAGGRRPGSLKTSSVLPIRIHWPWPLPAELDRPLRENIKQEGRWRNKGWKWIEARRKEPDDDEYA